MMDTSVNSRANDALRTNYPDADRHLSVNGSNWLWAVTALMGLTFLAFLAWTISRNKQPKNTSSTNNNHHSRFGKKQAPADGFVDDSHTSNNGIASAGSPTSGLSKERVFHYLFTIAAFIAFISYFTMASNLGNTPVRQYMNNGSYELQTRSVFYVRYIYYFTAWPLVLTAVLLLSGVSWATLLFIVALQEIWVVSWLCGALVSTSYKWGYFTFGLFAYIILSYLLLTWGMKQSGYIRTKKTYTLLAGLLVVAWALFPIAWGLSEGSNRISVTGEMIFYGILDLVAIPVFGSLFLFLVSKRIGPEVARFTQSGRVHGSEFGNSHGLSSTGHSTGISSGNNTALNNGHGHDQANSGGLTGTNHGTLNNGVGHNHGHTSGLTDNPNNTPGLNTGYHHGHSGNQVPGNVV
jgi:bacteriorhodopsin